MEQPLLNTAFQIFSESLKGVVMENFSSGFAISVNRSENRAGSTPPDG